jgi:hypothetical protein
MPLPARAEPPEPAPTSRERSGLASAISVLQLACAEAEEARQPVDRLEASIRRAAEVETALRAARQADQAELGEWIAGGCQGPRPTPSPETLAHERNLAVMAADAQAARDTLPRLTAILEQVNSRVRAASAQRASAVYRAAVAIAFARAEELRRRLDNALLVEAELNSLTDALTLAHNKGDHEALIAANEVRAAIMGAKKAAAVPHVPRVGSALLARLMTDPAADFEHQEINHGHEPSAA